MSGYGSLSLIGGLMSLAGGRVGMPNLIGLMLAVGFLVSGIQALTGKARGLIAAGVTSIVIGGLTAIAFLALGAMLRGFHPPGWLLGIGFVIGGMLITAGILGLVGNRPYKEFRATKGLY